MEHEDVLSYIGFLSITQSHGVNVDTFLLHPDNKDYRTAVAHALCWTWLGFGEVWQYDKFALSLTHKNGRRILHVIDTTQGNTLHEHIREAQAIEVVAG